MINSIVKGDCLEVLNSIEDNSIDCIFTDVPYKQDFHNRGMSKDRPNHMKIKEYGSDSELDYTAFFNLCISKLNHINFFTFCDKETKFEFIKLAKENDFGYKELCFCKTSPTPFCNNQWLPDVEYGIHIFKDLEVMGSYETKRSFFVMGNFKEPDINHPTAKKVSVCCQILKNITKEGQLILDPFSGSGTTAIACSRIKRNFICIEKNEDYYKASCERLATEQSKKRLF